MEDLLSLRNKIDSIDTQLVKLFEARMECVIKVAEYKQKNNMGVLHKSREEEVIKRGINNLKDKNLQASVTDFLNSLMKISKELQTEFLASQNRNEDTND